MERGEVGKRKAVSFEAAPPALVVPVARNRHPTLRIRALPLPPPPRYLPPDPPAPEIEALLGRLSMGESGSSSKREVDDGYATAQESLN